MQAILWDLDGTIQDSESIALEGTQYGFQQVLGRDPSADELSQLVGQPVPIVLMRMFGDVGRQIFETGALYYDQHMDRIRCYDSIPELLTHLAATGYVMGLVSSKRRTYVLPELASKGLDGLFDVIVGQEDTLLHKPNPEPLLLAVAQLGLAPAACIYIGDQPTDILAARHAGMTSGAALWGEGTPERLLPAAPDHVFRTPGDVAAMWTPGTKRVHDASTVPVEPQRTTRYAANGSHSPRQTPCIVHITYDRALAPSSACTQSPRNWRVTVSRVYPDRDE